MVNDVEILKLISLKENLKNLSIDLKNKKKSNVESKKVDLIDSICFLKNIKLQISKIGLLLLNSDLNLIKKILEISEEVFSNLESCVNVSIFFNEIKISQLFFNEIHFSLTSFLNLHINLFDSILVIKNQNTEKNVHETVTIINKINHDSSELMNLFKIKDSDFLKNKMYQNYQLLNDGFNELVQWSENPNIFDSDFESDDLDFDDPKNNGNPVSSKVEKKSRSTKNLNPYHKSFVKKLELINSLFDFYIKNIPQCLSPTEIDSLYDSQKVLVSLVDKTTFFYMVNEIDNLQNKKKIDDLNEKTKILINLALNSLNFKKEFKKWLQNFKSFFDSNN